MPGLPVGSQSQRERKELYVHGVRSHQPRAYRSAKGIGMDTGDAQHDRYLNEYCAIYPTYLVIIY